MVLASGVNVFLQFMFDGCLGSGGAAEAVGEDVSVRSIRVGRTSGEGA